MMKRTIAPVWICCGLGAALLMMSSCGREPDASDESRPSSAGSSAASPAAAPLPDSAFQVEWQHVDAPPVMAGGKTTTVVVTFKNASPDTWPDPKRANPSRADGSFAVRLSYRWWKKGAPMPLK